MKMHITAGVILEKDKKILLVQENRSRYPLIHKKWNIPQGKYDVDKESIFDLALHEAEEEGGFKVKLNYLVGIYQSYLKAKVNLFSFIFAGEIISGKIQKPNDELLDIRWVPIKDLESYDWRNPFIIKSIKDYLGGKKYPLSTITFL